MILVRHRLDGTQQAVKRLHFNSEVPPWAAETVEGRVMQSSHSGTAARLLRDRQEGRESPDSPTDGETERRRERRKRTEIEISTLEKNMLITSCQGALTLTSI